MPKIIGGLGVVLCLGLGTVMVAGGVGWLAPLVAIIAAEFLVLSWFVRRLATTRVTLGESAVSLENNARQVSIPYARIERIDSGSLPYVGGWVKVRGADGESLRVTVTLEGVSEFIRDLKQRVDRLNPAATYDRDRLFGFYKTAAYCEQSWSRLTGFGRGATVLWLVLCFAPIIALEFAGAVAAVPVLGGVLVWLWSEFVFARHVAKQADPVRFTAPARDRELERKTLFAAAMAWIAIVVPAVGFLVI